MVACTIKLLKLINNDVLDCYFIIGIFFLFLWDPDSYIFINSLQSFIAIYSFI